MRAALIFMVCGILCLPAMAQENSRRWVQIFVDSTFAYALPSREADWTASLFEGDRVEAVGRNADGTWFQVTRPYQEEAIGWVDNSLGFWSFDTTLLPLTDATTGVTGATPIVDLGVSVYIIQNAALREAPGTGSLQIGRLPYAVTVPVIERETGSGWLHVNYLGTTGWVAGFLTYTGNDLTLVPVWTPPPPPPGRTYGPLAGNITIIAPEVQMAQINRLWEYLRPPLSAAYALSSRIYAVLEADEILPCEPVTGQFGYYSYTLRDVYELPELGRYGRRIPPAIDALNEAIERFGGCGAYSVEEVAEMQNLLSTASGTLGALSSELSYLERTIFGG